MFASGNLINFLDVRTNELKFRRSYLGGGIGHITTNPNAEYSHLTVAENGDNPPIIIYEWPSMEIFGILKEGAAKRYAHINYRYILTRGYNTWAKIFGYLHNNAVIRIFSFFFL